MPDYWSDPARVKCTSTGNVHRTTPASFLFDRLMRVDEAGSLRPLQRDNPADWRWLADRLAEGPTVL